MLKKLLKGCLAVAMVGAFATGAYADVVTSGNAWFGIKQVTVAASGANSKATDTRSYLDMTGGALTKVTGTTETGGWTASGNLAILFEEQPTGTPDFKVDGWSFSVANEGMTIALEDDDLGDVNQGQDWVEWGDGFDGAGDNITAGDAFIKVSLDMGLTLMFGINEFDTSDSTTDQYSQTDIGVKYSGAAGDISYAVSYQSASKSIDENADAGTKDGANDGKTESEIALGVGYEMGQMGFNLALSQYATTPGGTGAKESTKAYTSLAFDFGLSEDSGLTLVYETVAYATDGEKSKDTAEIYLGYVQPLMGASLQAYYTTLTETPKVGDATSTGSLGARLKYEF